MREWLIEQVSDSLKEATWAIPSDFLEYTHYERAVKQLDWTSSPGYPYMRRATTNGVLFKVEDGVPAFEKLQEYWEVVKMQIKDRLADPIRLFIKAEPLKEKKLEEGRYRLISSVSVVDQIIDHMLFGVMNKEMIDNWIHIPPKVGWNQLNGGWRIIPHEQWMALDKSSWDWTVHPWLAEIVLSVRAKLCSNLDDRWMQLALWRYQELFINATFITSGGLLLKQVNPGVMKSGCVNTITDNSIMQMILHIRVSMELNIEIEPLYSMGDDTLQRKGSKWEEYLELMGQYSILKQCIPANEFAGCRFYKNGRIEPLYKGKHAFTLLHVDPEVLPQLADSYRLLYFRSSYRDLMYNLFSAMGQKHLPYEKCNAIYDGY